MCFSFPVLIVISAESPGTEVGQPADESQTTPPGGRQRQKRETDRGTVGSH